MIALRFPLILLVLLTALTFSACKEEEKPKGKGKRAESFRNMDKNGDGVLTQEEVDRPEMFQRADGDGNGKVTMQEARAFAQARKSSGGARRNAVGSPAAPAQSATGFDSPGEPAAQ